MTPIPLPFRFALLPLRLWCAWALCLGCASVYAQGTGRLYTVWEGVGVVSDSQDAPTPEAHSTERGVLPRCGGCRDVVRKPPAVVVSGAVDRRTLSPAERARLRQDVRGAYERGLVPRGEAQEGRGRGEAKGVRVRGDEKGARR